MIRSGHYVRCATVIESSLQVVQKRLFLLRYSEH